MDYHRQYRELSVVIWDIQTGGLVSVIGWKGPPRENVGNTSITYSANGMMIAVFRWYQGNPSANVFIFNIASGTHVHSHSLDNQTPLTDCIWTYGESLRFATSSARTITIWEVGFTSGATPTEVEILTTLDDDESTYGNLRLFPIPCRLALVSQGGIMVRDVRSSEYLLHCADTRFGTRMSFSSDGRFFACSTTRSDIYLWKESLTGYILHEKLSSSTDCPSPLLSPNGESIVVFGGHTIRLWHTKSSTTTPSSTLTQLPRCAKDFVLDFSPDGALAVVTVQNGETIIVLDLKSGVPRLAIDAGITIRGLGVIGNTVVVVGDRGVVTWNLPAGDRVPDARIGLEDCFQIKLFHRWQPLGSASISPNSRHIATISGQPFHNMSIYRTATGKLLEEKKPMDGTMLWFSPDGCDVWCVRDSSEACQVWSIIRQEVLELPELEWRTVDVEGYPWRSSRGYQVTNDWWILGPDGRRLLMLPPPFQSHAVHRVWKGRFLALLHGGLSEPVILELDP